MKTKALLAMTGLLLIVFGYVHFFIERPAEQRALSEEKEAQLLRDDLSILEAVEIRKASGDSVRLALERGYWFVQEPFQDLARLSQVERLYRGLKDSRIQRRLFEELDEVEDLEAFGLSPGSRLEIELSRTSAPGIQIVLGRRNPRQDGIYALVGEAPSLVVMSRDLEFVRTELPNEYREMKLVNVEDSQIQELEIQTKHQGRVVETIQLRRNSQRLWRLLQPEQLPVDQEEVQRRIARFPLVRASQFVEGVPEVLRMPTLQITALFEEGVRDPRSDDRDSLPQGIRVEMARELKSGAKDPGPDDFRYYAITDKTPAAQIARFHYDNFHLDWRELVRRDFDLFLNEDIVTMNISNPSESFELVMQSDGLKRRENQDLIPASESAWKTALQTLRQMRAENFKGSLPDKMLDEEFLRVELTKRSGEKLLFLFDFSEDPLKTLYFRESSEAPLLRYEMQKIDFPREHFGGKAFDPTQS